MKKVIRTASVLIVLTSIFLAVRPVDADEYFDTYGLIPWEEERGRLDNFAIALDREKDMIGYIIFYTGEGKDAADIENSLKKSIEYMICRRNIPEDRLRLENAGQQGVTTIILQPWSKDAEPLSFSKKNSK